MTQFKALQQKLGDLTEELKPIMEQSNAVNGRISDFQDLKGAAVVCLSRFLPATTLSESQTEESGVCIDETSEGATR